MSCRALYATPSRRPWASLVAAALVAIASPSARSAPGAHGPGGEHLDAPTAAVRADGLARLPDGSVSVPKLAQRRMEIRTKAVQETEAAAAVQLPARVVVDPNASGRVQAAHGGRIEPGPRGLPVAGQAVKEGEVLAWVRHHAEPFALGNQQAQLSEIRSARTLAEQRVLRLKSLEGTVPRKDIEAAEVEVKSLAERERSVGGSLAAREALAAPVSGVIARTEVASGQVVESRDVLFEVIDPSRLLVEATTSDPALAARIAGAHVEGVPGAQLRLLGAARVLRDGVLPLTFSISSPGRALPLAVGQPVTLIATLRDKAKGIVLPAQAVVRNPANEPVVWIKSGAERFIPQPIEYRPLDASTVLVTKGLGADNRVVVQGAPLIAQIR
jgi:cobalt-zinc-cadmium efflux system membrane fusion protein